MRDSGKDACQSIDKTTRGFVIAACSVVIEIPVVWIGWQFRQAYLIEQERQAAIRVVEEQARQKQRRIPCSRRSDDVYGITTGHARVKMSRQKLREQDAWIDLCVKSTAIVEELN